MLPFRLLIALFCVCLFSSCKRERIEQDGAIDSELTMELDSLYGRLVKAMSTGRTEAVAAFCNKEIKESAESKRALGELVGSVQDAARQQTCEIKKRVFVFYPEKGQKVVLNTGEEGEHGYSISYRSPTRRTFTVIGYFEDSVQTTSLLTIWGNYDGEWKLISGWAGLVKAYRKDAVDWYYRARQQYGNNALADAANSMAIGRQLITPAGDIWHYKLEEDMLGLVEQIKSTVQRDFRFPIAMERVASAPQVFGVVPNLQREGYYPVIRYATSIGLQDTLALSRECDSINAHIGAVFNDIDHNNHVLYYQAYASIPEDSTESQPYYQFVRKSASWHY